MKGKNTFTVSEINELKRLIALLVKADRSTQKSIRAKMRRMGFYGWDDYGIKDCQPEDLDKLIKNGEIKVIADIATLKYSLNNTTHYDGRKEESATPVAVEAHKEGNEVDKKLTGGQFVAVNSLNELQVPTVSGLYCIKLRKGVLLPAEYRKIREDGIIYIGKAEDLRERLWGEELNLKGPATFFRGIGAILGYLPPKGSLIGKSNQNNYTFSAEDTEAIRKWMRQSLFVNWITLDERQSEDVEKTLIKKYQPLMNYSHNPNKNKALIAARKRCREYAQGK